MADSTLLGGASYTLKGPFDLSSVEVVLMQINQLVREIKVCGPYEVALLNWAPIFEWYMAKLESKNEHQKMCYNETGEVLNIR